MFSYLIPCNKRVDLLEETLASIDIDAKEVDAVIVVDDYAVPSLAESLNYSHEKIKVIRNIGPKGIVGALNYGASVIRSNYILRLDADDLDLPYRLQLTCEALNRYPDADIISFGIECFPESSLQNISWNSQNDLQILLMHGNPIYHPTVCLKKSIFTTIEYSNHLNESDDKALGAEDYLFWCRAFLNGFKLYNSPEVVVRYRTWVGQASNSRSSADPCIEISKWFINKVNKDQPASFVSFIKLLFNKRHDEYRTGIDNFFDTAIKRNYRQSQPLSKMKWLFAYFLFRCVRK